MTAGLQDRVLSVEELLSSRRFPARIELPAEWERYYRGEVRTGPIRNQRRHTLKLAY